MSTGATNFLPADDTSSSFAPTMNPSTTGSSTPTPTPGLLNAEIAASNGMQSGPGSAGGREGSYVPQFSAATEMILRRMRGEPTGEFDPASSPNVDGWEEARAKVMMGMRTSMNMDMGPLPQNTGRRGSAQRAAAASRAAASRAASRRASSTPGPAAGGASNASTPVNSGGGRGNRGTPTSASRGGRGGRGSASKPRGGRAGGKRKRQVKEESESVEEDSDNMSKLGDDSSGDDGDSVTNMPSMTSSGRQIQKPKNFNPIAMDGPPRKRAAPKKVQEQALCKRCGRGHSPQSNMIVFCDGCNMGWHQMCHDPIVSDEVVKDESSEWFCAECTALREEKSSPIKSELVQTQMVVGDEEQKGSEQAAAQEQQTFIEQQSMELSMGVSGIEKSTLEEKRAHLSNLPHSQLVALLLHATTLHPDLPLFPPPPTSQSQQFLGSNSSHNQSSMMIPATAAAGKIYPNPNSMMNGQQQHIMGSPALNSPGTRNPQQQSFSPSASGLFARAEMNPNAPINFIRKIPSGNRNGNVLSNATQMQPNYNQSGYQSPFLNQSIYQNQSQSPVGYQQQGQNQNMQYHPSQRTSATPSFGASFGHPLASAQQDNIFQHHSNHGLQHQDDSILPTAEGDTSRESTPASPPYPRPGNGLMRKLPPDDQDLEWLEDKGDYEAFSHVVYDAEGRGEKIEEDGVLVAGVGADGIAGSQV